MAYSEENIEATFKLIIQRLEEGKALRTILKEPTFPSSQTFYKWLEESEDKSKQYAHACNLRAEAIFDEIIAIADDSSEDELVDEKGNVSLNKEFVARSRLKIDARKWVASKLNPKKFGDKIQQEMSGDLEIKMPVININFPKKID